MITQVNVMAALDRFHCTYMFYHNRERVACLIEANWSPPSGVTVFHLGSAINLVVHLPAHSINRDIRGTNALFPH